MFGYVTEFEEKTNPTRKSWKQGLKFNYLVFVMVIVYLMNSNFGAEIKKCSNICPCSNLKFRWNIFSCLCSNTICTTIKPSVICNWTTIIQCFKICPTNTTVSSWIIYNKKLKPILRFFFLYYGSYVFRLRNRNQH